MPRIASLAGLVLFVLGYLAGKKFFGHDYLVLFQAAGLFWGFMVLFNTGNYLKKCGIHLDWLGREKLPDIERI